MVSFKAKMKNPNKIFFVTQNKHKFLEAKAIFSEFGILLEQINDKKHEPKDMEIEEVAKYNAKLFYEKYKKPVIVDDTGIFFMAYPKFPGSHPKLIFEILGYKGILKLLENEDRRAYFKTAAAYYDGIFLKVFEGKLSCIADTKVNSPEKDVLPYERILLVDNKPISSLSRKEKNKISHRAKAFRKLAAWFLSNK